MTVGDAYGWTDNGRQVFDPLRLEKAAADLRKNQAPADLRQQLVDNLLPSAAVGQIPGGQAAYARLYEATHAMLRTGEGRPRPLRPRQPHARRGAARARR
jgi:hypothetical protein